MRFKALVPVLRRLSRIGKFDISSELDYLVVKDFERLREHLPEGPTWISSEDEGPMVSDKTPKQNGRSLIEQI